MNKKYIPLHQLEVNLRPCFHNTFRNASKSLQVINNENFYLEILYHLLRRYMYSALARK